MVSLTDNSIQLFSTCPGSSDIGADDYRRRVIDVARWSEEAGCRGILVYSDNSLIDPWLVSQLIIQQTASLSPLVAIQPVYMHPYAVAKMITSLGALHHRRIYLNMVTGGFKNDLTALNDLTAHDRRYDRLIEYTTIIMRLLSDSSAVSYDGEFYRVDKLTLSPALSPELLPGVFVSGSSEAGVRAARTMGATAVKYPAPSVGERTRTSADGGASGIRVGIISREDEASAWAVARARFPDNRLGQLTRQLANKISDSVWHKQLADLGDVSGPYWLAPFQNYQTMCPYLVGSHEQVAAELLGYMTAGSRTFILDVPPNAEELKHIGMTFNRAVEVMRCQSISRIT